MEKVLQDNYVAISELTENFNQPTFGSNTSNIKKSINELYKIIPSDLRNELWNLKFEQKFSELLEILEHVIPQCIDDFEFFLLAAISCREIGRYKEAMSYFQKALTMEPNSFAANFEIGKLFVETDMPDLAEKTFAVCSELEPTEIDPLIQRSLVLYKLEKFTSAKHVLLKALEIDPRSRTAYDRLVMCYIELAEFQKANDTIQFMLDHKIGSDKNFRQLCHANLLTVKCELWKFDDIQTSISEVEDFVKRRGHKIGESAEPRFNLATTYLRLGKIEEGWKHYYHRFDQTGFPTQIREYSKPRLTSISGIEGKTLLIWREQGVGDELTAYGLIEKFRKATGANIILETDPRLVEIVQRSNQKILVRGGEDYGKTAEAGHEDFDFHMPMADMFVFLKCSVSSSDWLQPWLSIDEKLISKWNSKIQKKNLRVAFACQSHLKNAKRAKQSNMDFDFFAPLIEDSPHTWVCLDYNLDEEIQNAIAPTFKDKIFFPKIDLKNDFHEVAAILKNCDILLSPYMALRSLAGATGTRSASFVRGTPYHFDLGASLMGSNYFMSPLTPNSSIIQFPDQVNDYEFNQKLLDFFEYAVSQIN